MSDAEGRRADLARNLETVRGRIATACSEAGRDAADVTLVVVTKFFPASDVRHLAGLGVAEVAENRHQEAQTKAEECAELGLRWHMVGGLQSNKAAAVTAWAHVVESVDRVKLVGPLVRGTDRRREDDEADGDDEAAGPLDVLVQVSLDDPATTGAERRAGVDPDRLLELADRVAGEERLRLRGLMAVAPLGQEPAPAFDRLADLRVRLREQHPAADVLSAGMSADLEAAVTHGATHVRVGSAVLGPRPSSK